MQLEQEPALTIQLCSLTATGRGTTNQRANGGRVNY